MCRADKFPEPLPEFQRMFPDDAACSAHLKSIRWREGFVCPRCASTRRGSAGARAAKVAVSMTRSP